MIDVKMQNGELSLDAAGRFIVMGDRDARFQRALIAMSVKRGAFVYNRELGTDYDALAEAADAARKTEQIFNEALADYDDTSVTVAQTGEHTLVGISVNGEVKSEEVVRF